MQGIIHRLAGNSFLIKGWAITLVSAILGLSLKDPPTTASIAWLAIVPTLALWGLDAHYLALERSIRLSYNNASMALYNSCYHEDQAQQALTPTITGGTRGLNSWAAATISRTTSVLYLALLLSIAAVATGLFARAAQSITILV